MRRQVEIRDGDLDARHIVGRELCAQLVVAVSRRRTHRVRADRPGSEAGDPQLPAARVGEVRVHPGDLAERQSHTVPPDGLEVLHLAPAEIVDHAVERDRPQAQLRHETGAARPGGVVQHREEQRAGVHGAQRRLVGATDHGDDVARHDLVVRGEPGLRRGSEVGLAGHAHACAVPVFEHDRAGARTVTRHHHVGQEVAPLARLLMHARQPEDERSDIMPSRSFAHRCLLASRYARPAAEVRGDRPARRGADGRGRGDDPRGRSAPTLDRW